METKFEKFDNISQNCGILIDGNNIEIAIRKASKQESRMLNMNSIIPRVVGDRRKLKKLFYFREGKTISPKLEKRLHEQFYGIVVPCRKTADTKLIIHAIQMVDKVDTIIIFSGDSDYIELVQYLKSKGVRVEIASIESSTSKELLEEVDYFHKIDVDSDDDCYTYKT
jgi:uncharacterized LabA/DUF88 family protein